MRRTQTLLSLNTPYTRCTRLAAANTHYRMAESSCLSHSPASICLSHGQHTHVHLCWCVHSISWVHIHSICKQVDLHCVHLFRIIFGYTYRVNAYRKILTVHVLYCLHHSYINTIDAHTYIHTTQILLVWILLNTLDIQTQQQIKSSFVISVTNFHFLSIIFSTAVFSSILTFFFFPSNGLRTSACTLDKYTQI